MFVCLFNPGVISAKHSLLPMNDKLLTLVTEESGAQLNTGVKCNTAFIVVFSANFTAIIWTFLEIHPKDIIKGTFSSYVFLNYWVMCTKYTPILL